MKPFQIGLFVLVGALGGAVTMKFMQRPKPVPAPIVAVAPAPVATPAPATPVAPELTPVAPPAPVAEERKPVRHAPKPPRRTHPPVATVARNLPPPRPQPPAPEPVKELQAVPAPEPAAPPPSVEASAPAPPPEPVEEPAPQPAPSVTLQSGMLLTVRLGENLSSEHNQAGDTFTATLDAPVSADGFVIAERGARAEGRIVEVQKSNRTKGQAALVIELTRLSTTDGQHVTIQTDAFRKQAAKTTVEDVGVVAAAAGIGAVIGAIAGGGKGAAIGAGAGGAAGVGGVAATRGKAVSLPSETRISFRLKEPVTITERLSR